MLILVAVLWGAAAFTALLSNGCADGTDASAPGAIFFAVLTGILVALAFYFQHA